MPLSFFLCFFVFGKVLFESKAIFFGICVRWWRGGLCVHIMFTVGRACAHGGVWRPERDIWCPVLLFVYLFFLGQRLTLASKPRLVSSNPR